MATVAPHGVKAIQINTVTAKQFALDAIRKKHVMYLAGSPGIGKSAIYHEIANEYGLKLIDLRLSQCDPTDLAGFPHVVNGKATYLPMDTFPLEGEDIPAGYNGWLLFLDEVSSASPAVQSAAYKLVLDRKVGQHKLHKNVAIAAAGNLESDNAIVESMSTALQSRFIHYELTVDPKAWIDWAHEQHFDHRITSYIEFKPGDLYTFSPEHTDRTYACPRTWAFANDYVQDWDTIDLNHVPQLSGVISEGVARSFIGFAQIFHKLPTITHIATNPTTIEVPQELSILHAITGMIGEYLDEKLAESLMKYVVRLPKEFQVFTLRSVIRRNKTMLTHPTIRQWIATNANELF